MSADQHMDKAQAVAVKIAQHVEYLLAPLDREMDRNKWSPEFRAIMWNAVVAAATTRATESTS